MKKIGILFATFIMVVLFAMSANALESTGQCGDNVYWKFNDVTGELLIYGEGDITHYGMGDNNERSPFSSCDEIKSVIIEDGVTGTGCNTFDECYNLESVSIPDSATDIGFMAFSDCTGLQNITIPGNIEYIGEWSFAGCTGLTNLTISDGVECISIYAFNGCSSLEKIIIPDSVKEISSFAFWECTNLKSVTLPDNLTIIDEGIFSNCTMLTEVEIPDSVTSIGKYAFNYCSRLESIELPNGITTIETEAFGGCESLENITIPDSVTTIGPWAFNGCSSMTNIIIPERVTTIGSQAFNRCDSLTSITVDKDNTAFSNDNTGALFNKDKTTIIQYPIGKTNYSYSIPDGVTTIGENAFAGCGNLGDVTIPDGVTSIGVNAFASCNSLTNIVIPNSVKNIDTQAFYCCDNLESINLPDGMESIGARIISGTAYQDNDENRENGALYIGDYLLEVSRDLTGEFRIKDGTLIIADQAFYLCDSITSIIIPEGLTTIGDNAFIMCFNLEKVTIPESVTSIGKYVFSDSSITDIYYNGSEKQWKAIEIGEGNSDLENISIHFSKEDNTDTPHTHSYTSTVTKKATCTAEGVTTYTCSCGDSYTKTIAKLTHQAKTSTTKATFKSNGGYKKICKLCGKTMSEGVYYKVSTVKLSATKYTYDGKTKKPSLTIKNSKGTTLKEGKDYTVKYESGRKEIGKYSVKITLIGNYEGTKTLYFSILPGKTSAFYANPAMRMIRLSWKEVKGATGYRVYQYNSKTGKYDKIKTTTKTEYHLENLNSATGYKFAVKAYTKVNGETLWSESIKTVKTCTKPFAPKVKATASDNKITIKWNKVSGATGYVIYMQDEFGDYKKIGSTKKLSYSVKDLEYGKTYRFRVKAYKNYDGKNTYGDYTNVKATVPLPAIYVTPTGKRYHFDKECAGKNAIKTTYANAIKGRTPCKTCVL